ncbi:hypothetical protein [Streptomyces erythrochromogenes]|uniref:hypothetical protein n=1 Tax=Streptomyces erythrochromogenes TaxID=285574 RepID=UPI0036802834
MATGEWGDDALHSAPLTLPDETVYYTPRVVITSPDQAADDAVVIGHGRMGAGKTWNLLQSLEALIQHPGRGLRHVVTVFTVPKPIEELIRQGLGTAPDTDLCDDLRNRRFPQLDAGTESPNLFGTYVLSAGFLVPPQPQLDAHFAANHDTFDAILARSLAELAELITVWLADLRMLLQRLLASPAYGFNTYVSPHACSPCGVIRLASPEIPRGPQPGLHLDAPAGSWALAA